MKQRQASKDFSVSKYNSLFENLSAERRLEKLYKYYSEDEVLFTSSFGIHSPYLLYLISKVNRNQKVHFINTGYLFQETIQFKNEIAEKFGLEIIELQPNVKPHNLTLKREWWKEHPKMCCAINKISPLNEVKEGKKIWVSGIQGFQTTHRANLGIFVPHKDLYKFHPLIDMDEGQLLYEIGKLNLPKHPLADNGYGSIGCTHCTVKGDGREGRWANKEKTECGLHLPERDNK